MKLEDTVGAPGAREPARREARGLIDRVQQLARESLRLEHISLIKRLQRAYGYYIDKGYWREASDLFHPEATLESGVDGVYVGKERIHRFLVQQGGGNPGPGLPYGQLNHHMQLQAVIHLGADERTAKGRWRELALLGQFQKFAAWGDGVHENEYVLDGVWMISKLRYYPNFVAPYVGGWAIVKPAPEDWRSDVSRELPPDRPPTLRYKPFPEYFVPPFHYSHPVTGK